MNLVTTVIQIFVAPLLIFLVLIQSKGQGLSSTLSGSISFYRSRRGLEKAIFILTIFMAIVLVVNSLLFILT